MIIEVGTPGAHDPEFLEWLRGHGLDPNRIFKIEIEEQHLQISDGTPVLAAQTWMTVHQYALNEDGAKFYDEKIDGAAYDEPFEVRLKSPVPNVVKVARK